MKARSRFTMLNRLFLRFYLHFILQHYDAILRLFTSL